LQAIKHTGRIDYFVLDVDGDERNILDSLPWEKLEFGVVQVINVFVTTFRGFQRKF